MIARRINHHFLPHFVVDAESALAISEPHRVHHKAHALSATSLFIYLQVLIVVGASLFIIRTTAPQILGTATFSADQIISLTNQKRAENGLGALTYNAQLASAATAKASDMFANDYWAHNSPSGRTPWSFITAAGYKYIYAGENLARDFDDAGAVVDAWMNSSSHRDNLLDKNFKEIGVAVSSGKLTGHDGILVVQEFGASVSQANTTQIAVASPTPAASASASPKPVVASSVIKSPEPSPSPVVSPTTTPVTVNSEKQSEIASSSQDSTRNDNQEVATVLASRKFSIAKIVSLAVIGFIFLLFAAEILVTLKRERVYLRSGVLAHLLLLAFVLLSVWYAVSGAIL